MSRSPVLNAAAWLRVLVPDLWQADLPAHLAGTGLTVNPVHVPVFSCSSTVNAPWCRPGRASDASGQPMGRCRSTASATSEIAEGSRMTE